MAKMVGISRNIKLSWLNKAAEMFGESLPESDYKGNLNEYLSFEIESAINLRKTREILMHIWYYDEKPVSDVREKGFLLIKRFPDYAMNIHWCMILLAYPVFADFSKMIGRISEFQEELTLSQLKQKMFDEWGERTTLYHSTDKIIATMKEIGALHCDKPGKYHIKKIMSNNTEVVNFMLEVAMKVYGKSYYTFLDLKAFDILFPFEYTICREQLMLDDKFNITTFGGEVTVALK